VLLRERCHVVSTCLGRGHRPQTDVKRRRIRICPPPFIVISFYRHACQLIKFCSENATFYPRQSVVFYQWHPVRIAGRIVAGSIMAAASISIDTSITARKRSPIQVLTTGTNRARRGLTSIMRRTPLTITPRCQPCETR